MSARNSSRHNRFDRFKSTVAVRRIAKQMQVIRRSPVQSRVETKLLLLFADVNAGRGLTSIGDKYNAKHPLSHSDVPSRMRAKHCMHCYAEVERCETSRRVESLYEMFRCLNASLRFRLSLISSFISIGYPLLLLDITRLLTSNTN